MTISYVFIASDAMVHTVVYTAAFTFGFIEYMSNGVSTYLAQLCSNVPCPWIGA